MTSAICRQCNLAINRDVGGDDHAKIICKDGCQQIYCPLCVLEEVVNRKFSDFPCHCGKHIENIYYVRRNREGKTAAHKLKVENHSPDFNKDPARYYASLYEEPGGAGEDKMILSLSFPDKRNKERISPSSFTVALDIEHGPETQDDEEKLRCIFSLLHQPIMQTSSAKLP